MRIAPSQSSGKPLRIGVEQQLVGVEAVAVVRLIGTVNAIAVKLPGGNVVQIAVPDVLAALRQLNAFEFATTLADEQSQLDLLRVRGEQRKSGASPRPACTEARGRS